MSIKVTCPNGHALLVKSEFAGKSGLCPHCKGRIEVPKPPPAALSEDDLLAVIGPPRVVKRETIPSDAPANYYSTTSAEPPKTENAPAALGPDVKRRRVCPRCCEIFSISNSDCPRCLMPLSDWTFPVPDEHGKHESSRAACLYLGLRKQGDVIVIRFGEHKILDEATVKRFGDELFHVAERPDCEKLLLNFAGVVGLCSAMLGMMLMLRKKMSQNSGQLKLCQVGPEILDTFRATKLGQLFEIMGSEQQALRAFT